MIQITVLTHFSLTNLANVNRNTGILVFLNVAHPQNLVLTPGSPVQINTVYYTRLL